MCDLAYFENDCFKLCLLYRPLALGNIEEEELLNNGVLQLTLRVCSDEIVSSEYNVEIRKDETNGTFLVKSPKKRGN